MREDGLLTALPGGRDPGSGRLRVTAFVTPRIDVSGDEPPVPLSDCPSFSDWAYLSAQIRLSLAYRSGSGSGVVGLQPDPSSPVPSPSLWQALFVDVGVGSGQFQDLSGQTVASVPAKAASELIRATYTVVAEQAPTEFPAATAGPLSPLREIGQRLRDRRVSRNPRPDDGLPFASGVPGRYVDRSALAPSTSTLGGLQTFIETMRFYDRPGAADPLGPDTIPPAPDRPRLEFHGFVSALADYPEVLRHLGLALDFLLDDDLPAQGQVRFEPVDLPVEWARTEVARPWTAYEIADRRFIARPRSDEDELVDGSLRLESERLFLLEQVDLDGGVLKLANTAASIAATAQVVTATPGTDTVGPSMTPDAATLPALRSGGLTLYRSGRARRIVTGWDAAKTLDDNRQTGVVPELFAEDVTRGYRLDVAEQSQPKQWRSLHARTGTYLLRTDTPGDRAPLPLADPIADDEGYVKAASTTHNAAEADVAYLHEAVAGWEGWSLAAPRPGNRIGIQTVEAPVDPGSEERGLDVPLEASFRPVKGSLPSLRFGRSYRMRARLVDMAGRSVAEDALDERHVTPFATYYRWDPVPAPAVIPRRPFTEGESLLRMVIRSTLGVSAADYATLDRITGLPGHVRPDLTYRSVNERHLSAPSGSVQLAELHGLFDAAVHATSTAAERDAAFAIAARSAGTYLSPGDAGSITDGNAPPRPVVLDDLGRVSDPGNVDVHNLQDGQYVIHDVDQLTLPYLPDPLAVAASFTGLPGLPETWVLDWPGSGPWYDRRPICLRIEDGSGTPAYDADARLLRVFLPPAEHAKVRLSSVLPRDALPLMGVWMLEHPAVRGIQEDDAQRGRHWMLTPWTTLELVHAVERPLAPPVITVADPPVYNSGVFRRPGDNFAALVGTVANHAKSTGRLDIDATWTEPIDDPTKPSWDVQHGRAHVGDFALTATENDCRIGSDDLAPTPGRPPTHRVRHEFGDTKHRWVTYRATATTRFREFFPPEVTDQAIAGEDLIRHLGPTVRLNVPSSHRPDPPRVQYVVPTWSWEDRAAIGIAGTQAARIGVTRVRTRTGGGLRVYLSRPWFSSGEDEQLGVVIANTSVTASVAQRVAATERMSRPVALSSRVSSVEAALLSHMAVLDEHGTPQQEHTMSQDAPGSEQARPHVSTWGTDPAWGSERAAAGPHVHHFALRTDVGTGITLPGQRDPVTVVAHAVQYDAARGLWFCDLQLDAGTAYQPFINLVLVRYQPYSINGCHASAAAHPGFIQLLPDRTAAITPLLDGSVQVSLRGPSGFNRLGNEFMYGSLPAQQVDASREVTARLQVRAPGASDLDWRPDGAAVRLHATGDSLADIRWHGRLVVDPARESGERRLVITEYELFETDSSQAETTVSRPVGGVGEAASKTAGKRLVFATEFVV